MIEIKGKFVLSRTSKGRLALLFDSESDANVKKGERVAINLSVGSAILRADMGKR